MTPGLVNQSCTHEESQWDFKDCKDGEETWMCRSCGETILRYIDCNGG